MAIDNVTRSDDPIEPIQQRVYRARAICQLIAEAAEPVSTNKIDLLGGLLGLADMLDGIFSDLDPQKFRAAVLASESVEAQS